jgi:uncharacterized protein
MRIRVDEIPESGRFIHLHWDEHRLNQFLPPNDPTPLKLSRPLNVDLEIQKQPDHIRVLGTIAGVLQLVCHRCLEAFERPLEESVDIILVQEEKTREEEETEFDVEDLDYRFFDGEVIEIDDLVAEQIFLTLPFKVLCSESCLGLCQRCGGNLNEGPCRCEKSVDDSPFGNLKAIRSRLPEKKDR